ncbi:IMPACT family protein [Pseudomonas sp. KNUC1026]|uniref:IMPACT family protein n=1 Tax=Pseudomonas sp. KNUC1026 TaxID=2893890 RepID=UPI001F2F44C7|nr:YigZ family protein [Pseudomonas sp. KNUC1026]UFH49041.1 IMPACT family protein [Pseudomonas sp. KNUC1026]
MPSTLIDLCEYREDIRKSRFIALAGPAESPEQAQAFLARHSDIGATHNCWAWKLGSQYRSSDDGEPGGTAGRPILAAIEAQGCDQVVVLVIRWYGGIQLGTGGLARAYGGCANKCLQQAAKIELVMREQFILACTFSEHALVRLRIQEAGGLIEDEAFTAEGVNLRIALPPPAATALAEQLTDLSRGRIRLRLSQP